VISKEPARSGHLVLIKDGKYLDSSIDPVKSAEKWALSAQLRIADAKAAVVLGLGSGYHIAALQKLMPEIEIIVIESDATVAASAKEIHPSLQNVKIIVEDDWSRLLENDILRLVTKSVFRIVKYPASVQANDLYYQRAETMILARDRIGFFLQIRDRAELLRVSQMEKLEQIQTGTPISVKTILDCQRPAPHGHNEREALLWKILGELVK
jgi:hypothetical protein